MDKKRFGKCCKCGAENVIIDNSNYCKKCRQAVNKIYREQVEGNYIYTLMDRDLNPLYIGSTKHLGVRISNHLTGNSHLKRTIEDWKLLGLYSIDYTVVEVQNREERLFIEMYLIEKLKPLLNGCEAIPKGITEERQKELEHQAENLIFRNLEVKLLNDLQKRKNA